VITQMVARLVRDPFDREGWFFELKWDGFRAIAEKDKLGVRLYSRNQNDFKKRFPTIAQAVSALDNVILDGEIVALDEQGHPRFEWLVNRGPQKGPSCITCSTSSASETRISGTSPYHGERVSCRNSSGRMTLRYVDHIIGEGLSMFAGEVRWLWGWKVLWQRIARAPTSKVRK